VSTTSRNSARQTRDLSGVQGLRPAVAEKPTCVRPFVRNNKSETISSDTYGSCLFELNELLVDNIVNGSQRIGNVCPVTRSYENSSASTYISVIKLTVLRGSRSLTRRRQASMLTSNTLRTSGRGNTGRAGGRRRKSRVRLLVLR
jgi:hypothetical protein